MSVMQDPDNPSVVAKFFTATVLRVPLVFLVLILVLAGFSAYYAQNFGLDASSDAIVLENDPDLKYYNETREIFGSDDYVIITVTPHEGTSLFDDKVIARLGELVAELEQLEDAESVTSILNVPLFHSPPISLMQLASTMEYKTLAGDADRSMVLEELTTSPLYKNYLIAEDGSTTAIQVTYKDWPEEIQTVFDQRNALREKKREEGGLSAEDAAELHRLEEAYKPLYEETVAQNNETIRDTRAIVAKYGDIGELHIGGVPMIMADIISYVRDDMMQFGGVIVVLVLITLGIIFRNIRWIILPTAVCVLTVLYMFGYLGYTQWNGTIVTSNFSSLLFVIALADVLHLVVHYRELHSRTPDMPKKDLILQASRDVAVPCLYTTLTTIVGFGSLIVSGIRPVMDFGIMMAMGVGLAYIVTFILFPAGAMLFPHSKAPSEKLGALEESPLMFFARFSEKHHYTIFAVSLLIFIGCVIGAGQIKVENRFIDYFHEDTPIYQGMSVIDQRLGGTTPLEVVLEGPREGFWLEQENIDKLREVHNWLDELPETGKVISPVTMLDMLQKINNGSPVPLPMVKMALDRLPAEIQDAVVGPYMTPDRSQVRIAMRAMESDKSLNRRDLMGRFDEYFTTNPIFEGEIEPHVTGVFVLYNNLLQSLFDSQIKSIAAVFGVIWFMFLLLFRSFRIATIAIVPNILPVTLVLGFLGWSGIPLDLMTIMTAAITLGIAVDFAIHYIHRYKHEFAANGDYTQSMYRTHNSIGRAMMFTTITIIAGFSILTISNFIPSIYFGLFTSLAIIIAFLASVTLLPLLMITLKPLGPEKQASPAE